MLHEEGGRAGSKTVQCSKNFGKSLVASKAGEVEERKKRVNRGGIPSEVGRQLLPCRRVWVIVQGRIGDALRYEMAP